MTKPRSQSLPEPSQAAQRVRNNYPSNPRYYPSHPRYHPYGPQQPCLQIRLLKDLAEMARKVSKSDGFPFWLPLAGKCTLRALQTLQGAPTPPKSAKIAPFSMILRPFVPQLKNTKPMAYSHL